MSRYYSLETIRANAKDVTLTNGAKHRCIDPDALLDIESADVRENVRGEWLPDCEYDGEDEWCFNQCSLCDYQSDEQYNYCPNCGADMRGEA